MVSVLRARCRSFRLLGNYLKEKGIVFVIVPRQAGDRACLVYPDLDMIDVDEEECRSRKQVPNYL